MSARNKSRYWPYGMIEPLAKNGGTWIVDEPPKNAWLLRVMCVKVPMFPMVGTLSYEPLPGLPGHHQPHHDQRRRNHR